MKNLLKKQGRLHKYSAENYQFQICLWIALGKTTKEIQEELWDRLEIKMSAQNINANYRYSKRWRPVITYLRKRYLNNISRIPIANKAYRLAILQETLREALTWRTKSVSEWGKVEERKIGIIPALIAEARNEVEGLNKLGDSAKGQMSMLQVIKILSNGNGKATIIENRIGDSQAETDGMDRVGAGRFEVL